MKKKKNWNESNKNKKTKLFNGVSADIILNILIYCDIFSIINVGKLNWECHIISKSNLLWVNLYKRKLIDLVIEDTIKNMNKNIKIKEEFYKEEKIEGDEEQQDQIVKNGNQQDFLKNNFNIIQKNLILIQKKKKNTIRKLNNLETKKLLEIENSPLIWYNNYKNFFYDIDYNKKMDINKKIEILLKKYKYNNSFNTIERLNEFILIEKKINGINFILDSFKETNDKIYNDFLNNFNYKIKKVGKNYYKVNLSNNNKKIYLLIIDNSDEDMMKEYDEEFLRLKIEFSFKKNFKFGEDLLFLDNKYNIFFYDNIYYNSLYQFFDLNENFEKILFKLYLCFLILPEFFDKIKCYLEEIIKIIDRDNSLNLNLNGFDEEIDIENFDDE
jgi:hypothetical protein